MSAATSPRIAKIIDVVTSDTQHVKKRRDLFMAAASYFTRVLSSRRSAAAMCRIIDGRTRVADNWKMRRIFMPISRIAVCAGTLSLVVSIGLQAARQPDAPPRPSEPAVTARQTPKDAADSRAEP